MAAPGQILISLLAMAAMALAQEVHTVEDPDLEATSPALLRQAPTTIEEINARIEFAQRRRDELQGLLSGAPAGEREGHMKLRKARESLAEALDVLIQRLQRQRTLSDSIAALRSAEGIQQHTADLEVIEARTAEIKNAPKPIAGSDESLKQTESELKELETRINGLVETQTRRTAKLAPASQKQREDVEADLAALKTERDEVYKRQQSARATATPEELLALQRELERLDVRIAAAEIARNNLAQERQETELLLQRDEGVLAVLRKQLDVVTRRFTNLREAQSRDRVDQLERLRDEASEPSEIALLDAQLFCERVLAKYFRNLKATERVTKRFTGADAERLKDRLALANAYWTRAVDAIGMSNGDQAQRLQEQLDDDYRALSRRKDQLRTLLTAALEESQLIQAVRDRAIQRFHVLSDSAMSGTQIAGGAERTRVEAELTGMRVGFDDAMRKAVEQTDSVVGRLGDAIDRVAGHQSALNQIHHRLQWKRLTGRGSGLMGTGWQAAWNELRTLVSSLATPATPDEAAQASAADVEHQLFGDESDISRDTRRLIEALRQNLAKAPRRVWLQSGAVLFVLCGVGYGLHYLARRRGVALAGEIAEIYHRPPDEPHPILSGLSARIDLLGWNQLGDLAIPVLTALSLCLAARQILSETTLQHQLTIMLGCVVGMLVLLRLVHHLFEAESPPHRPIPCSDLVARHYRQWFGAIIVFSLVYLPLPLMLLAGGLAGTLQAALFEVYQTVVLLLLFCLLIRKGRVLGSGTFGQRGGGLAAFSIMYPVIVLAVVALLVMEIIGYGALVTFVGTRLLLTGGIVLLAMTATEYLADAMDKYADRQVVGDGTRGESHRRRPGSDRGGVSATQIPEGGSLSYAISLLRWLLRMVGLTASILCILFLWNVPLSMTNVNWRVFGFSALVLLITLLLDHILFTALKTLQAGGRLPDSTGRIVRRWIRGVLTVLCVLSIAAIAGFKIESLWSFLVTVLAMVAIGFVAVWSILSNILATFIILIWRPFNVGEWIEVAPDGVAGQVVDINFIYTILRTTDGRKISIPNNLFAQKYIRRQTEPGAPERSLAEQLVAEKPLDE